jgi:hypothetical protein
MGAQGRLAESWPDATFLSLKMTTIFPDWSGTIWKQLASRQPPSQTVVLLSRKRNGYVHRFLFSMSHYLAEMDLNLAAPFAT